MIAQILVGQRHVDDEVGLDLVQQRDRLGDVVGIDLRDLDRRFAFGLDLLAAFEAARGKMDLFEDIAVHRALLRDDRARSACPDDKYVVQRTLPDIERPVSPAPASALSCAGGPK